MHLAGEQVDFDECGARTERKPTQLPDAPVALDVVVSAPTTMDVGAAVHSTSRRTAGHGRLVGGIVAAIGTATASLFLGTEIVESMEATARWVCERILDYATFNTALA